MRLLFISAVLLVSALTAGAQNCNIKNAYAFYTVTMPGMQMADEHGNPIPVKPSISRFIYVEWSGTTMPVIDVVLYNNKALPATLTAVKGSTVIPGTEMTDNRKHKISAKKGNKLWKIELQPAGDEAMPATGCKNILIKIKGKAKACSFKVAREKELAVLPSY